MPKNSRLIDYIGAFHLFAGAAAIIIPVLLVLTEKPNPSGRLSSHDPRPIPPEFLIVVLSTGILSGTSGFGIIRRKTWSIIVAFLAAGGWIATIWLWHEFEQTSPVQFEVMHYLRILTAATSVLSVLILCNKANRHEFGRRSSDV